MAFKAVDGDLTPGRQEQGIEVPYQGGFAAAVGSDEGDMFAFPYTQINVVQGRRRFRLISIA